MRIYPTVHTGYEHDGYRVWVDGVEAPLNTARVSAMPCNRRWPGHQRPLDQSELINFLSMEADGPVEFRVMPKEPAERAEIRPASLGVTPKIEPDGAITFTLPRPAYFTLEPYGRRNALHLFVDPPETDAPDPNGDNVIYFGKGEHDAGVIDLKSGQTLYIDAGAVVYASVTATDAENICICGRGILDNSKNKERILFEVADSANREDVGNAERRHTVQLEYCKGVTVKDVTIRDSLVYNVRPIACEDLRIFNVKIIGCWRYNSDGIDMHNCVDVRIDNCFLRTFDDSICVKGFDCYYDGDVEKAVNEAMHRNGKTYDVFRGVRVRGCTIWNDWGKCLEIGAETRAEEITDVVFEDCSVIHATGTVLDCMNVDYADVHGVVYRGITVELDDTVPQPYVQKSDDDGYRQSDPDYAPKIIAAAVTFHHEYSAGGRRRGRNRDIVFSDISLIGRQKPVFRFAGYDEDHGCENIRIERFLHNGKPIREGDYDLIADEFCRGIEVK